MERLAGRLRNGNRELENSNLDMLDLSTLLPDSWEQTSTSRFSIQSSGQSTPENQWINSAESDNELLPLLDDLDTWAMDLDPTLRTPREITSQSIEAIMTPMSFTGHTDLRQLSDSTNPISFGLPSPPSRARQDTPGDPCACVQTQATNISTLHQLTCRDIPSRFDLAMKSITSALETCEKFITCDVCDKSFPSMLLTLSAIELIFKLFEQLTKNNEGLLMSEEQHLVSCSLGDYKVTRQESQAIQNVLVKMTLSKGKETLDALQSLVGPVGVAEEQDESEFTRRNSTGHQEPKLRPLCSTDQEYMIQYIKRRNTALEALIAAVGA
ncbi:related to C6 transcription factor GliZ-like [Fusarium torulosum]|uniref:Related to C6 transcription factor GliZ-like n=1 Tax=Fusarium torulosum TaxID=33205 RepID=A0AAE8SNW7_9HYPO|nr:related to C6 transcription factor GliZ-like [Fusarium torulosum]